MTLTYPISIQTDDKVCANCAYFYQHYIRNSYDGKLYPCHWGHCGHPRVKDRLGTDTCKKFKEKS